METLKGERLDFNDLIHGANGLLSNASMAEWVRYKLDQNISHILIDEAQDTSPLQWHFIAQLTQDLFTYQDDTKSLFVVGDIKQSIYSFQGAFAESFMHFHDLFKAQAQAAEKRWWDVSLTASFRTTGPLLTTIDRVFNETSAIRALGRDAATTQLAHVSARTGDHGELIQMPKTLRLEGESAPVLRTAQSIADHIQQDLASGRVLVSKGRPVHPADYLILVQQRGPLTQTLYTELVSRHLPVSPPDRTRLNENLVIQDLLALGRWALNRQDDWSLACLLTSPFSGLDAQTRDQLCLDRGELSLWAYMKEQEALKDLCDRLERWAYEANSQPVCVFYTQMLAYHRDALEKTQGPQIFALIEAFLSRITQFEKNASGLQSFLEWFDTVGDMPIKRILGHEPVNQIRIMTIHGAKGLQAPIVILADATRGPEVDFEFIQEKEGETLLWIPTVTLRTPDLSEAHEVYVNRLYDEYYRLLYVALTRAEDELLICGWEDRVKNHPVMNWYECVESVVTHCHPREGGDPSYVHPRSGPGSC
jgi:ATP-dependent helicase/nuclease subunit A